MGVQTGGGSDVVVKITPTLPSRQRQLYTVKKYSSTTSADRTEENNCMDCSQCSNERLSKTLCVHEIINCFHLMTVIVITR